MTKIPFDKRLNYFAAQFAYTAQNDDSVIPEYNTVKAINDLLQDKKANPALILEVVEIFNKTNEAPHKGGISWRDFRVHVGALIRKQGMKYIITSDGNLVIQEEEEEA